LSIAALQSQNTNVAHEWHLVRSSTANVPLIATQDAWGFAAIWLPA
jgi:hypothetical protein